MLSLSALTEIRTLLLALKGLRPSPLDDEGGRLFALGQEFYMMFSQWSSQIVCKL